MPSLLLPRMLSFGQQKRHAQQPTNDPKTTCRIFVFRHFQAMPGVTWAFTTGSFVGVLRTSCLCFCVCWLLGYLCHFFQTAVISRYFRYLLHVTYIIYIYLTFSLLVASCVGTPIIPWMLYMCFCIFILNMTPMSANMSYMYGIGKWKRPDIFRISEVEQSFL